MSKQLNLRLYFFHGILVFSDKMSRQGMLCKRQLPACSASHRDGHLFNYLFYGTMLVSWHQKGKTILEFNEAWDDGVAVASAANHLHHAADR